MKQSVYIETTIISYLTAWPSRDLVRVAQQRITMDWWTNARAHFDTVTSELVVLEASAGDPEAAAERIKALESISMLTVTEEASRLADNLIHAGAIPSVASRDALHVGICASNGIHYLLTWNFKHLANATLRDRITDICEESGYAAPVICTPDELSEVME
ncbi:MAG: type II toxin-antitoxin system VapC family toxin [Burkholderiales bacterium]|nr:type II toxin-antitoxin system VapC family toxin [Phycisphaerae bacterium]